MDTVPLMKNQEVPEPVLPSYEQAMDSKNSSNMVTPFEIPTAPPLGASQTYAPPQLAPLQHIHTSVVTQPTVREVVHVGGVNVGPSPINTTCANCQNSIRTRTETTHKCSTHCCCCLLFFSGVCCPLIFLPYCCCSPEKVEHTCPHCKALVGNYYG